ncbi:hypothetical protein ACVDG5_036485 [Mesorhizobium sp. ORM6]
MTRLTSAIRSLIPQRWRRALRIPDAPIASDLPLGSTTRDVAVSIIVKGGIGSIPVGGAFLAELIGLVIPEQRLVRLEDYARHLNDRLHEMESDSLKDQLRRPEAIDLIEEGAIQSSRAVSEDRRQRIAMIVADGVTGEEKAQIEAKRILRLLEQIDDDQIVILSSYLRKNQDSEPFHQKHSAILRPIGAHIGSSREDLDRETIYNLARDNLIKLGLLASHFTTPKKGEIPEFDARTGMLKASSRDLTPLGRLFLSRIGLSEPGEF